MRFAETQELCELLHGGCLRFAGRREFPGIFDVMGVRRVSSALGENISQEVFGVLVNPGSSSGKFGRQKAIHGFEMLSWA